jgi:ATP-binding cassette subfamily B protein
MRVLGLLGREARLAWILAFANLALAIAQFAEPVLFGRIIDALTGTTVTQGSVDWSRLLSLLGAWIGFGLFTIGCGVLVALHADRLAHRQYHVVRTAFFEHVLQLPQSFHGGAHSGRLMKVMLSGTNALWSLWLDFFREYFAAIISVFVLLPVSLFLNWQLGLLLVLVTVCFGLLTALVIRKTETMQQAVEAHSSDLAERSSDALGNVALVQGFARIEAEISGMQNLVDRLLAAQMPVLSWWAVAAVLTRASTTLTTLAIFLVGLWLHFRGEATIGQIVTFINFAGMLMGQLEKAVRLFNRMFMEGPKLKEFFDVYDTVPSVRDAPGAIDPGRLHGLVEFKNVSFSYDGKRPAVADLNFAALPGQTVALVGATGAGKSTALALLHRAFDPQSGSIQVDGMDIRAIKVSALRSNIGVVHQEVLMLNRSIAENLRVGKPDATEAEMRDAAARAEALDFIERNPDGFNARVGERGRLLSGGERQRLSIARVLLKNPPILILDEATSALDATTERKVQAALDEVMKNRTTFVIAHRLSTIRNATRILVFEGGRITESGTFDELVKLGGHFAALARAQYLVSEPAPSKVASKPQASAARRRRVRSETPQT